jgi:excisionase family DNA binding protein
MAIKVNADAAPVVVYTLAETAKALKLSRPTVSKLVKEGKLRARRIGRRVIISREAVADFLGDAK